MSHQEQTPNSEAQKQMVSNGEEVLQQRKQIDDLLIQHDFDGIGTLPGFTIIERKEDIMKQTNRSQIEECVMYAMGCTDVNEALDTLNTVIETYQEVMQAQKGDIVIYYQNNRWEHVAVAEGRDRVRSRFGQESHVYEHPLKAVPTIYGNTFRFFREP